MAPPGWRRTFDGGAGGRGPQADHRPGTLRDRRVVSSSVEKNADGVAWNGSALCYRRGKAPCPKNYYLLGAPFPRAMTISLDQAINLPAWLGGICRYRDA